MHWLRRILVFVATLYVTLAVVLWAFQTRFIYPAPQSEAPLVAGYEEIVLQTEDGLNLRSFYQPAEEGKPTIIHFHGNGGSLYASARQNARLAESGLGSLLVGYRGYGGNPGSPSEDGLYHDGEAAIAWLKARGIDPPELILVANSIGGGVATELALRHSPKALVLVAPFTSLPEAAQANFPYLPALLLVRDQFRNAEKLPKLPIPVLIQHGDADGLVPYEHGQTLARLAPKGEFQGFAGSGHELAFDPKSQEARRDWILKLAD